MNISMSSGWSSTEYEQEGLEDEKELEKYCRRRRSRRNSNIRSRVEGR